MAQHRNRKGDNRATSYGCPEVKSFGRRPAKVGLQQTCVGFGGSHVRGRSQHRVKRGISRVMGAGAWSIDHCCGDKPIGEEGGRSHKGEDGKIHNRDFHHVDGGVTQAECACGSRSL